jgi:RNA polymerase sigma-70 factor (ECF subfamily)
MTPSMPLTVPEEAECGFDELFHSYYGRLAKLLYRVTGDMGRAEEMASEAFWRLHHKPPPARENILGWLYRTGVRLALDQIKQERRRARYEALVGMFGSPVNPETALEETQRRSRIRQTLAALKPEQVALLLLRSEGFSYAELAASLDLKPASIGTLLARAEKAFRKEYVNRYGEC